MITSKDNSRIKLIKKLLDKPKYRREENAFVLEGLKPVEEAVRQGLVKEIFVSESENNNAIVFDKIEVVEDSIFKGLSDTVTPQGILAIVKIPEYDNRVIFEKEKCRLLCLEEVRDPGNVGTMIRTAEAAGFDAVLLSPGCADVYQPKVVRSTAGAILRMPCLYCDESTFAGQLELLKGNGFTLFATHLQGAVDFKEPAYDGRVGVLIGNEANGLSDEATQLADVKVKIPMQGEVESLNAAVAAALLMYEVNR